MDVAFGSRFQFDINLKGVKSDVKTKHYNNMVNDLFAHVKSKPDFNSTIEAEINDNLRFHAKRGIGSFYVPDKYDESIKTEFTEKLNKKYKTTKGNKVYILGKNFEPTNKGSGIYSLNRNYKAQESNQKAEKTVKAEKSPYSKENKKILSENFRPDSPFIPWRDKVKPTKKN